MLRYAKEYEEAAERYWPPPNAAPKKRETRLGIRIFENRFVERVLARAHPITPILWTAPPIVFGLARGATHLGGLATLGAFFGGWLIWTLLEYLLHRFVFHMEPKSSAAKRRAFMMHGYHHEFSRDRMRLVAPPLMAWPIAAVILALYWLAFGPALGPALFAGTAVGYVAYDWTHYYTHHMKPTTRIGRYLQRYHLMHHFDGAHGNTRFGVSSPLWDIVFGTYRSPSRGRREKT